MWVSVSYCLCLVLLLRGWKNAIKVTFRWRAEGEAIRCAGWVAFDTITAVEKSNNQEKRILPKYIVYKILKQHTPFLSLWQLIVTR